jgi:hypothetical protein
MDAAKAVADAGFKVDKLVFVHAGIGKVSLS